MELAHRRTIELTHVVPGTQANPRLTGNPEVFSGVRPSVNVVYLGARVVMPKAHQGTNWPPQASYGGIGEHHENNEQLWCWSRPFTPFQPAVEMASSPYRAVVLTTDARKGSVSFTFRVEKVTHATLTYDPAANVERCDRF